jgi:hypothetical protein
MPWLVVQRQWRDHRMGMPNDYKLGSDEILYTNWLALNQPDPSMI